MKLSNILKESFEPYMFKSSLKNNIYDSPFHDMKLKFEYMDFKKNWCRLKFRVYNPVEKTGGFLIDVILSGDLDDLIYQIDDIARIKKRKYGDLEVIQRKVNNKVSARNSGRNQ